MTHPYSVEKISNIEVILKICTLFKGKPYGPAYILYTDEGDNFLSFEGVGIFTEGLLHMGPFTCINKDGIPQ
jgi:hypothetical protein